MSISPPACLTPRDINNISMLKEHGLNLMEVRISHVSFAKGQLLANIRLPETTRVICILRSGKPILDMDAAFLEENDFVYLITDDEDAVRTAFTI